jgi:hypothetical protein
MPEIIMAEWHRFEPFVADPCFSEWKSALAGQLFSKRREKSSNAMPEALVRD